MELEFCLKKIADLFETQGITYGLGASMLLFLKGLVQKPRDLDFIVAREDVSKADRLLRALGKKQPSDPNSHYATRFFGEYVVEGIDVDLMAGFKIKNSGKEIEYTLDPSTLKRCDRRGTTVWLCPVEDWFVLYLLMPNRENRVSAIREFLLKQGADYSLLERWLQTDLPAKVKWQIEELFETAQAPFGNRQDQKNKY